MPEHRLTTARRARYYTSGGLNGVAPDTWIVLHGFGQLAAEFLSFFESIATPERLVVAPEALNRFYVDPGTSGTGADAKVGATWMTREDREREIDDYVDFLDAVWAETAAASPRLTVLGSQESPRRAAGRSAAGRFHRLVAWAGQLPADVNPARLRALPGGLVLVTGTTDEYATWVGDGDPGVRLAAAGVSVEVLSFDGGHRLDRETLCRLAGT